MEILAFYTLKVFAIKGGRSKRHKIEEFSVIIHWSGYVEKESIIYHIILTDLDIIELYNVSN